MDHKSVRDWGLNRKSMLNAFTVACVSTRKDATRVKEETKQRTISNLTILKICIEFNSVVFR